MKARPLLKYGAAIAICAAGLAVFWLSDELMAAQKANAFVRVAVFVCIAIAMGFVTQSLQGGVARDSRLEEADESGEKIPGSTWAADARGELTAENANGRNYLRSGATVKTAIHADDQKTAERQLESRAYHLQQRIDAVPVLLWSARPDGSAEFLNRRWLEYTGLSLEQASGSGWLASIHPDDRNTLVEYWKSLLETATHGGIEARLRSFDGEYRWFLFKAEPLRDAAGRVIEWLGSNTDIHDLKKAEENLRAHELELLQFADAVPAMVCILTPEGEPSYVNKRLMNYLAIAKISDLDASGSPRLASAANLFVHPDDRAHVQEVLNQSFASGESYTLLHRLRRADGVYRWVEARGEALRDESGRILKWYSVNVDVDDSRKAEEALQKRERELQLLVDTIPTGVWCLTPDGEPDYINKRLETYYGRTVDPSEPVDGTRLDRALERLMHPDDLPALQQNLGRSLRTGESFAMRYRNRRADGVYRWVDARAEPLRDEDGRIVRWYGVTVDIDEGVRAQEALRTTREKLARAAQIANLSQLSGAIAHEVNQPLTAIVTNGQACERWLSAVPPNIEQAQVSADRIIRNSMRAKEIISRTRALFKHKAPNKTQIDINEVIGEVYHLMIDEISSEGVLVEMDLDPALPPAFADRVQIQQLLINLMRNGIDAMRANRGVPKSLAILSRLDGRNFIRVDIRDNGEGIGEPGRIFEPFFTTKEGGMGIGLAICRSIVESHEGSLWATSNEPKGAVFSFTLPIGSNVAA